MSERSPKVALTLVRLKVALLRNRARSSRGGRLQLAVGSLAGLFAAVFGAAGAVAFGRSADPRASVSAIVIGATALCAGWAVLPLLSFGTDETLDPARLVLLPLRRGPLMRGLLLASLVGIAPLAVTVVAVGAVAGYGQHGAFVVGLAAMALLLALSVAAARTLSTVLAAGLSSRRGRDAVIIVASLLALGLQALRFAKLPAVGSGGFLRVAHVLRWTPPGMLGQAVIDARSGRWVEAVAQLLPAAALVPVLLHVWGNALERSLTVVAGSGPRRRQPAGDRPVELPLVPKLMPALARVPWGAVVARELRYATREPRRKVLLANSVIIGAGVPLWLSFRSSGGHAGAVVLLATLAGWIALLSSTNQFGLDGAAAWTDAAAGDTTRLVLLGKNVALAMTVMPVIAVVAAALGALHGGWAYVPAALLLGVGGLGAGLATANVVSVRYPVRLPEGGSPFSGAGGGQGFSRSVLLMACMLVQNLLLAPVVAAAVVGATVAPVSLVATAPLCAAYGLGLWLAGLNAAGSWGRRHVPELLRAVDPAASDQRPVPNTKQRSARSPSA